MSAPVLTISAPDGNDAKLDWTATTGPYTLNRSESSDMSSPTEVYSGALLTYTDADLLPGTYYYQVDDSS